MLARAGIYGYESKRLKLYTDIEPAIARTLPPVINAAYEAWEAYFGPLPPNPQGTDFQITGYLMNDKERFRRAGLVPDDLPPFINGRHRGAEFWMNDQEHGYYRRHLLIHESTHCFMTALPGVEAPLWYMEGMAELFGTHTQDADGSFRFRVMPYDKEHFAGLGRITVIQDELRAGRGMSLPQIGRLPADDFLKTEAYAWSWGVCEFLDAHPRYRDRFRELGRRCVNGARFVETFEDLFHDDFPDLWTEWPVFVSDLTQGFDFERSEIDFQPGQPLRPNDPPRAIDISAARGWQSSGVLVERGERYQIAASGRFAVGQEPKPWLSEPQGISFWYAHGKPLGMLLGAVRSVPNGESNHETMLDTIAIGPRHQMVAVTTGTLYLRVNDFSNRLADNTGTVHMEIRNISGTDPSGLSGP